jgi:hypothetical protein
MVQSDRIESSSHGGSVVCHFSVSEKELMKGAGSARRYCESQRPKGEQRKGLILQSHVQMS